MCQRKGWGEPRSVHRTDRHDPAMLFTVTAHSKECRKSCWSASRGLPHSPQNAGLRPEIPPNWYSLKVEVGQEYPASNCG